MNKELYKEIRDRLNACITDENKVRAIFACLHTVIMHLDNNRGFENDTMIANNAAFAATLKIIKSVSEE